MAIFAPSTSPAYGDPYKALTLKALEKRQQDFMNQMAQATAPKAETPMAVAGVGLGAIGDALQKRNMDNALTARRGELASLMAGIDPVKGPNAQQQAQLYGLDPELGAQFMKNQYETAKDERRYAHDDRTLDRTQGFQREQSAEDRGFRTGERVAGQEFTAGQNQLARQQQFDLADQASKLRMQEAVADREFKSVQAELDRATQTGNIQLKAQLEGKLAEAQNKLNMARDAAQNAFTASQPKSDAAKITADANNQFLTPDEATAAKKKLVAPTAAEQKIVTEQKIASIDAQSAIRELDEALGLTNSPKGIHAGNYAAGTQAIGEYTPSFMQGSRFTPDPETTKNTQRFNQIMGGQALEALTKMKGASSDKDVAVNFKIVNDPNASVEQKRIAIGVLKTKLTAYLQAANEGVVTAGGEVPKLPDATTPAPAPAPAAAATSSRPAGMDDAALLEEGRKAINAGKDPAFIRKQLESWGVKGGL